MKPAHRQSVASCVLLAFWSCQPCLGFLGSLPCSATIGRSAQHQQRSFQKHERFGESRRQGHSSNHGGGATARHRGSPVGLLVMIAAPADLWHSYLGALETAPLLTKVGPSLTWIPSYRLILRTYVNATCTTRIRRNCSVQESTSPIVLLCCRMPVKNAVFEFQHDVATTPQHTTHTS